MSPHQKILSEKESHRENIHKTSDKDPVSRMYNELL